MTFDNAMLDTIIANLEESIRELRAMKSVSDVVDLPPQQTDPVWNGAV